MRARWATFDCYGTLVDWNTGIRGELERLFGPERAPRLLHRYHELEPQLQRAYRPYREVLDLGLAQLAREAGAPLRPAETDALSRSLPRWPVFADVREALTALRNTGWRLAVLSNSDRDLITASVEAIGVPFDVVLVAEDVGSYKPAPGHWQRFFADTQAARDRHVHVAASLFHDVAPARQLGLTTVWVNRLGEAPEPQPTRELPDLNRLPATLDDLVPA